MNSDYTLSKLVSETAENIWETSILGYVLQVTLVHIV